MSESTELGSDTGYFYELTPERVLEAVESSGLRCTGRCVAMNSFENRVYDVELELDDSDEGDSSPGIGSQIKNKRVVKFYRPGRWSREQILEEHEFLHDLKQAEIPVVAPLPFSDGGTLRYVPQAKIAYAIFPKVGGRAPDELTDDQVRRIGRLAARIHNVGAAKDSPHRITLNPMSYGKLNLDFLLAGNWIPLDFQSRYQDIVERLCSLITPQFEKIRYQRIHGDCHLGNLLWNQEGPFFLDFDDMVRGPAVQDLWLVIPGRDQDAMHQRRILLEGYEEFREFDRSTLALIEPLRALRYIHYSTWIARRWSDQAFKQAFPQFGSHQYWSKEVEDLEEQFKIIRSSPLSIDS